MAFCHLHNHDEYSQLDGFGHPADYAKAAKDRGQEFVGVTNHGNVDGCIKFQAACEKEGVKAIIGCEAYIVPDLAIKEKGERRKHLTLLVKNQTGWENLLQMLTVANVNGFYRRPRIDPDLLKKHFDGLVVCSGCASSPINSPWGFKMIEDLAGINPDDVYLEIMPHILDEQTETHRNVRKLSRKLRLPLVATNDCHYPTEDGTKAQEVMLAIQSGAKWKDPDRWCFDIEGLFIRDEDEFKWAFKQQDEVPETTVNRAIKRSIELAEKCSSFEIKKQEVSLPSVPGYEDEDEDKMLWSLILHGLDERVRKNPNRDKRLTSKDYDARIKEEYGLITELGFTRYFLIVWELISWCRSNNILCGPGRGSVGGSLVAYLLYITDVDPLVHKLIFARFISPARIDLPDIDMDFEDRRRVDIRRHLEDCYGEHNVAGVSTFLTLKGRSAIRDIGRVFEVPFAITDAAAKSIVIRSGGDFRANFTIEDAFETFEDGIKFREDYPNETELAMKLEGMIRSSGKHAAAMCVSKDDLRLGKRVNLVHRKESATDKEGKVINWEKEDAEYVGLMKLDVLGLSALTVLAETREMIKANHGEDIDFSTLTLDDPKVFEECSQGNTIAAFQIGSPGLRKFCSQLGIANFRDIVDATSLWRPGTLRSGMTEEYVLRKQGKEDWREDIHPALAKLTEDTHGIIIYQEQVMMLMYELAGLPWQTCDVIRKVISKSQGQELFDKNKDMFVDGCIEKKTLPKDEAGELWDSLSNFGSYGFNLSHAVEYSMITYWDMWCKIHYPAEFMACSMTYGAEDKKEEYIREARRLGLSVELPKVGYSDSKRWVAKKDDTKLYCPFIEVKGIGDKTAQQIADTTRRSRRGEGFYFNESKRTRKLNKTVKERLEAIGAFNPEWQPSEDELEKINDLFPFDVSRDPMRSVRGIYEALKEKGLLDYLSEQSDEADSTERLYFGHMPEVKFGYRQNVLKARKGGKGSKRQGESLGGVYGFFYDVGDPEKGIEADSRYMVFTATCYERNKDQIEHCSGDWLLIRASRPKDSTDNIFCTAIVTEDQMTRGEMEDVDVSLMRRVDPPIAEVADLEQGTFKCEECDLRSECSDPVLPSFGKYNAMVVGEAPGKDEDKAQIGFVGRSGKLLWNTLDEEGIEREQLHVTNVAKCWPSKSRTPNKKQIATCAQWLDREIELTKPIVILAFGNTSLQYFKDQESGIMSLSGSTEWSQKHDAWLCYCIHPAMVLYSPENRKLFSDGVANFVRTLKAIRRRPE